jgi:uncharacterized low-complexity protein
MLNKKAALSLAIGSAFAATVAIAPVANAADNPFEMDSLKDGYQVIAAKKSKEGKCGEGRCGGGGTKAKKSSSNKHSSKNRTRTSGR